MTSQIEELRADTRTGDQVEAQAAKIERQTVEIKELRTTIVELRAGIEAIRAEVTKPSPVPEPVPGEETETGDAGESTENEGKTEVTHPIPEG